MAKEDGRRFGTQAFLLEAVAKGMHSHGQFDVLTGTLRKIMQSMFVRLQVCCAALRTLRVVAECVLADSRQLPGRLLARFLFAPKLFAGTHAACSSQQHLQHKLLTYDNAAACCWLARARWLHINCRVRTMPQRAGF